ncbi:amidohydrolase [Congregibacter litoralis]|uniref:Putative metal-dependent hydrolase with the TIM-barrel fold protein n=1 Tax=Congregibacter litoralis KT71 TaxID=314285 RepID=A4A8E3_9GAMM|nr:amidohydrolase [Congregibacter litoralis]EAQ97938.2 putative metal-dependent hydrolase with the TIM-barrel fold protein [Congregibacter litoralis KT71]
MSHSVKAPFSLFSYLLVSLLFCPGVVSSARSQEAADLVLSGGKVYTLNEAAPWAEAVAVKGDTIVYVGSNAGVEAFIDADTQRHDLEGRLLLPGFIDSHMHVGSTLPYLFAASLSPAMSRAEALATIAAHAEAYPEQNPLIGTGFLGAAFGPEGPTAKDLDSVVSDRPAIIFDEGFHSAWVNSLAMETVGLTAATPDPKPGAHFYRRYPDGSPTGWLIEGEAFGWVAEALGVIDSDILDEAADAFFASMSSMGITAAFDAGMIEGDGELFRFMGERAARGALPLRVVGSHYVNSERGLITALEDLERLSREYENEFFDVEVLKVSLDGTVEAQTAYTIEPYQSPPGHRAEPLVPLEKTKEVVAGAAGQGIDVHLHAIGDGAVRMALDLVEYARAEQENSTSRFTICHAQVVNPADVPRFGELDVIVQSTPTWYAYDDIALAYLGEERMTHMYPLNSIAKGGGKVTLGSDFPASWIGLDGMNPLFNIEMALTRQPTGDKDYAPQPPVEERITLAQALRGYTLDGAYQLGLEDQIGSITPGKQADMVVIDKDLFDLDPYAIHQTQVVMTIVDGRVVFEAP